MGIARSVSWADVYDLWTDDDDDTPRQRVEHRQCANPECGRSFTVPLTGTRKLIRYCDTLCATRANDLARLARERAARASAGRRSQRKVDPALCEELRRRVSAGESITAAARALGLSWGTAHRAVTGNSFSVDSSGES
jgi:hypothetical protein